MLLSKKSTRNAKPSARCALEAAASIASDFNVSEIARVMAKSPTTLSNKLNTNIDSHVLMLQEAIAIQNITNDSRILNAWAYSEGKTVIDLPDVGLSDEELADQVLMLQETTGDYAKSVRYSRADGVITASDFDVIQKRSLAAITAILHVTAELEQMVRPDPSEPAAKATALKVA
ncbi:phage regulatory CII family protein [Pseudoalteromonas nigrifaciens]|uniref:phage regulatory CII family protein n=1 Tax=Pseudoalteromonas nigrifaciens TaxID=28109 RepID=UPI001787E7EA|nr:phage regulatory CII family protein [Pseudoalteromonas nigrifaciens]MBE0418527.1 phage regulatory CII family protein [Pseudoalteromonas nigrifaciens]